MQQSTPTLSRDRRRSFSSAQRAALFLAADGRCESCDAELGAGWHADHVDPWSTGGATDVVNGQALCPACNLKKGAQVNAKSDLRDWQEQALNVYISRRDKDFLLVAQPGAGKTRWSVEVMHRHFVAGNVSRVVIVVPTRHLKKQWAQDAAEFGYDIDHGWTNHVGVWPRDHHGVAVTYQQIAQQPSLMRRHASGALVIFDEVHHCSHNESWGEAIEEAFAGAYARVLLSGTPFRSDGKRIKFITYRDGKAVPDFEYGYDDAIRHNVCRPVYFPATGGSFEWVDRGKTRSATFDDELDEHEASKRLRTALWPNGEWIPQVLRDADQRLSTVRKSAPNAGGIVFCMDQEHAHQIAEILGRVSGSRPVVAVSDDPDSDEKISRFRESSDKWIVSVRKVSEGVDIKRLRVAVYATNVVSEVFFRQAVGRVVRVLDPDAAESAWVHIPDDPRLRDHAEALRKMRQDVIHELDDCGPQEREAGERQASQYQPLVSLAEDRGVIVDGQTFDLEELAKASSVKMSNPSLAAFTDEQVALVLRAANAAPAPPKPEPQPKKTLTERKNELRTRGSKMLEEFAMKRGYEPRDVHIQANRCIGVASAKHADEEELERRISLAQAWLRSGEML